MNIIRCIIPMLVGYVCIAAMLMQATSKKRPSETSRLGVYTDTKCTPKGPISTLCIREIVIEGCMYNQFHNTFLTSRKEHGVPVKTYLDKAGRNEVYFSYFLPKLDAQASVSQAMELLGVQKEGELWMVMCEELKRPKAIFPKNWVVFSLADTELVQQAQAKL